MKGALLLSFFGLCLLSAQAFTWGEPVCCVGKFYHVRTGWDYRVQYDVDSNTCSNLVSYFAAELKEKDPGYSSAKYTWWGECPNDARYYPGFFDQ